MNIPEFVNFQQWLGWYVIIVTALAIIKKGNN